MFFIGAILRWAVLLGYLICAYLYIKPLVRIRPAGRDLATPLLILIAGFHALLLIETWLELGRMAIPRTALQATTLYALVLAISTLIIEARTRNTSYGAFAVPIAAVFYILSLVERSPHTSVKPILDSNWFEFHVTTALIGYAAFSIAFVAAVMYLTLARVIRARNLGVLFSRMPSLESLDKLGFRAGAVGFVFFTGALVTGGIWALQATGAVWSGEPKEVMSLVTWGVFALYLGVRMGAGWRGRRTAFLLILGFAASIITYFGVGGAGRHVL